MTGLLRRPKRLLWVAALAVALIGGVVVFVFGAYNLLPPSVSGEADRLAGVLRVEPGMTIAEIGAGSGAMTVEIARRLAPNGRVYSTELDPTRLADIGSAAADAGLGNVTVVEAGERETNLPPGCCDAIFMRAVYHHITDPAAFNQSLRRTVKDDGVLAVIDFEPRDMFDLMFTRAAPQRRGHGIAQATLVEAAEAAGFELAQPIAPWGRTMFLALFRPDGSRSKGSTGNERAEGKASWPVSAFAVRSRTVAATPPRSARASWSGPRAPG